MSDAPREYRFKFRLDGGDRSIDELTTPQAHSYLAWDLEPRVVKISVPIPGKPGQYLPITPPSEQGVKQLEIRSTPPGAEALIKLPLRSAWKVENGTHLVLPISVDTHKLDLLRETGQHWTIGAVLKVDSAQYFAAYGKKARGAKGLIDVHGQDCRVTVEFPHPFIYFPEAGGKVTGDYVLDTAKAEGSPLRYELRGFNPASRRFDRTIDEALEVEVRTDGTYEDAEARALKAGASGVHFKSKRVIIGHASLSEAARFTVRRKPGKPVRALNEHVSHPLTYETAAPATLAFRLIPAEKDAPPGPTLEVPLSDEAAAVHLPKVPGDYPGTVQWWIERGPARVTEAGAGFQTKPVTVKPHLARGVMTFDIELVPRPITRRKKPLIVDLEPPAVAVDIQAPQPRIEIDSGDADGTAVAARLVKAGAPLAEPLDVTCETLPSHPGAQLALAGPPRDDGFTLRTGRVLIGGEPEVVGRVKLAGAAGKPPARNQGLAVDVACKRHPSVDVSLEVAADGLDRPAAFVVKAKGEQVLVYFTGMPLATEGTVTWKVTGGAPRLGPDSPFRVQPQTARLTTHTVAGARVRGVDLELVPGPLTRAEPIAHELGGAAATTIFVREIDEEKQKLVIVDTTTDAGTRLDARLREWDSAHGTPGPDVDEPLDAKAAADSSHASCELAVVEPLVAGHVDLKTSRVLIGPPVDQAVAQVELRRRAGKPSAREEQRRVDVAYRREPSATLHVELDVEGKTTTSSVTVNGERVLLYCPDLEAGIGGTARWYVEGPSRATDAKSPFRHQRNLPPPVTLTDVEVPGQAKKHPGFEVELVPGAITTGDPVPLHTEPVSAEFTLTVSKRPYFKEVSIPLAARHADACRALARKHAVKLTVRARAQHVSKGRIVQMDPDAVKFPLVSLHRVADGAAIPLKAESEEAGEFLAEGTGDVVSITVDALLELERAPAAALDEVEVDVQELINLTHSELARTTFLRYGLALLAQYRDGQPRALFDTEVDRLVRQRLLGRFYAKLKLHLAVFNKVRELRKGAALNVANVFIGFLFDLIPLGGDVFKIWKHGMGHFTGALKEVASGAGDTAQKIVEKQTLLGRAIKTAREQIPGLESAARAAKAAREAVETQLAALKAKATKLAAEVKERVARVVAKQTELDELAAKVGKLADDVKLAREKLAEKARRIQALGDDLDVLDKQIEALTKEAADHAENVLRPARKALADASADLEKKTAAATAAAAAAEAKAGLEKTARKAVSDAQDAVAGASDRIAAATSTIADAKAAKAAIAGADEALAEATRDLGIKNAARSSADNAVEVAQDQLDRLVKQASDAADNAKARAAQAQAKETARDQTQATLDGIRADLAKATGAGRTKLLDAEQRLVEEVKQRTKEAANLRAAEGRFRENAARLAADADAKRPALATARANAESARLAERAATDARDAAKATAERVTAANAPKAQKLAGAEADLQSANAAKQTAEAQKLAREAELAEAEEAARKAAADAKDAVEAQGTADAAVKTGKTNVDAAEGRAEALAGNKTKLEGERKAPAAEKGQLEGEVAEAKPRLDADEKTLAGLEKDHAKAARELGDDDSGLKGSARRAKTDAEALDGQVKTSEASLEAKRAGEAQASSALESANVELAKKRTELDSVDRLKEKADQFLKLAGDAGDVVRSVYKRLEEWQVGKALIWLLNTSEKLNPIIWALKGIKWVAQKFAKLLYNFLVKVSLGAEVMLEWMYAGMESTFAQVGKEFSLYLLKQVGGGSERFQVPVVVNVLEATGDWTSVPFQHDAKTLKKRKDVGQDLKKAAAARLADENGTADESHVANFRVCLEQALDLAARNAAESFVERPDSPELLVASDVAPRLGLVGSYEAAFKSYTDREEAASARTSEYFGAFAFLKGTGGTLGEYMNFVDWMEWALAWGLRLAGVFATASVYGAPLGVVLWFLADILDVFKAVVFGLPAATLDLAIKSRLCVVASFSPLGVWAGLFVRDSELPRAEWVTSVADEAKAYLEMNAFKGAHRRILPGIELRIGHEDEPEEEVA